MNFLMFNFFSTIEMMSVIILLLSIFKYRVMDYIPQIILTSVIMSIISHTMHFELENRSLVPILTIIILFLFIWIFFRVSIIYAMIISVVGYVAYGLLQTFLLFCLQFIGYLSVVAVETAYSSQGYILQVLTSFLASLISFVLRKKNYGFNWIPYSSSAKFKLKGDNTILFLAVIVSVFVIGLVFYLFLSGYLHLIANFILIFLILTLLFYLAGKQEENYYD